MGNPMDTSLGKVSMIPVKIKNLNQHDEKKPSIRKINPDWVWKMLKKG